MKDRPKKIVGNCWPSKDGGIEVKVLSKYFAPAGPNDNQMFYECRVMREGVTIFEKMQYFGPDKESFYMISGTYKDSKWRFKKGDEFNMWRGDFLNAFSVEEEIEEISISRMMSVLEF
jgi:hypothetical protein